MTPERFHTLALDHPGAALDVKWGVERIYCVGGKMFASAGCLNDPQPLYAFKASELTFEGLIGQGLAAPAPYLARARWVQLTRHDALDDDALEVCLGQAYALVAGALTRKARQAIGLL
jgi:predicted DNA-binding protein (MmcQ/YjbR family)